MLSSILRIIEGTQQNDVEKVVRYAKRILPKEELEDELTEKCLREKFNPDAPRAVMDTEPIILTGVTGNVMDAQGRWHINNTSKENFRY